jgi:hypothetical protein
VLAHGRIAAELAGAPSADALDDTRGGGERLPAVLWKDLVSERRPRPPASMLVFPCWWW